MQPEGFHHALSEHQGLTFFDAVNRFRGERPVVGMDPGFYRREEEGPPGPFERPTRGSTLLSGRVRRQKLDENAVALERETARMAATQTRYTTPAPTRRTGFNARRRSSLASAPTRSRRFSSIVVAPRSLPLSPSLVVVPPRSSSLLLASCIRFGLHFASWSRF